uniref:Fc receptor, IgE, high affinity I, gamma polypeptide like n=1 Tax=Periophthalmus magnuspinnatus TaxID=409849 RepID=A0A3B4AL74_9GOBI
MSDFHGSTIWVYLVLFEPAVVLSMHAQICYVLDGILFLYGLVLTTLYCRLKVCIMIQGLTQPADTYETIGMKT